MFLYCKTLGYVIHNFFLSVTYPIHFIDIYLSLYMYSSVYTIVVSIIVRKPGVHVTPAQSHKLSDVRWSCHRVHVCSPTF
jgi:hypothetical protein